MSEPEFTKDGWLKAAEYKIWEILHNGEFEKDHKNNFDDFYKRFKSYVEGLPDDKHPQPKPTEGM